MIPGLGKRGRHRPAGKPARGAATRGPGAGAGKASCPERPPRRHRGVTGRTGRTVGPATASARSCAARQARGTICLMYEIAPGRRQVAAAATAAEAPAIFRVTLGRTRLRYSGPLRSVTSTRTSPSPALTAIVTVSPGSPEPLHCTLLPDSSLFTSKTATSPHGCTGPGTPTVNARGDPRPRRPPRIRHALPDRRPGHQRTRPSPPA